MTDLVRCDQGSISEQLLTSETPFRIMLSLARGLPTTTNLDHMGCSPPFDGGQ